MNQQWKIYRLVARELPATVGGWENFIVTTGNRLKFHLGYHPGEGRFSQGDDLDRFRRRSESSEVMDALRRITQRP